MSKWSQTKDKWKLTSISTTFMKTPKPNSKQKGRKSLCFQRLWKVHDHALQSARLSFSNTLRGNFDRAKCTVRVPNTHGRAFYLGCAEFTIFSYSVLGHLPKLHFLTLNSQNSSLIITLRLPYHSNTNLHPTYSNYTNSHMIISSIQLF